MHIGFSPFLSAELTFATASLKKGERKPPREKFPGLPRIQTAPSLEKIWPGCQDNSRPQVRIANSSTNAVSFSSAGTTKCFPSARYASAIQNVRPLESIAETQLQLQ